MEQQLLIVEKTALKEVIQETLETTVLDSFCNRFRDIMYSPADVAKMYRKNRTTVIAYIKAGAIEAEQRKKYGAYHIRLSEALRLDFEELKKNLKKTKIS
ncbi:MAG: helix-turn-helix domain-containing protein [Holosporaceae bacterium]|jgi:hypothetical protein|nr:helix-turn-helix domain-containing protein [Holosporaceae bacterium]